MSSWTAFAGVTLELDGRSLTLEDVALVARGEGPKVGLAEEARARMEASRGVVEEVLAREEPVYGVNTGFGRLSDVRVSSERLVELQYNLLRSHACGVGEPLSREEARALLLLRANVLAGGHSGVRPRVAEKLLALLNHGVVPVVPRRGSVGASGDLAPAAHAALVLLGEGEAWYDGERLSGDRALQQAGLQPLVPAPKEGLALLNGTQGMTALGALAVLRAELLVESAELAGVASLEGLRGTPEAFEAGLHEARPHPGQRESARRLRALMRDSEIRESHRHGDPRVQDAYSLRCMPQVHGAVRETLRFVRRTLEIELNSATDNPLVVPDREDEAADAAGEGSTEGTVTPRGRVLSGGNFHGQPVATALDHLSTAVVSLATISERRTERLVNPDLSGLPAFLTPEPGLRSGMMMLQVTAASQVAEARRHAVPASTGSLPTGAGKEDHVSMGMHAAEAAREAVDALERVLAVELIAAAQALEFLDPLQPAPAVARGMRRVREVVAPLDEDRSLSRDVAAVTERLRAGAFAEVVAEALRPF